MNDQIKHKYDNVVAPNNVYGHVLELLPEHIADDVKGAVHLDLACGFGHIAEHVTERFGVEYVGVDLDDTELDALRERGFEAHAVDLGRADVAQTLTSILAGRRLASITFLDGLEHITDGTAILAAIGQLVSEHRAILVVSVPNVTHVDVGVKTLLGEWTYTHSGLLDDTHYTLYSARSLEEAFAEAGLARVGQRDFLLARSDQHFPEGHVGLSAQSSFGQWVRAVRETAEPNALVNQFIWALAPTPPKKVVTERPMDVFLSVIVRTQGRRLQELREALLCLSGQTNRDFEVLLMAHRTSVEEQIEIERIVGDQPKSLRDRIRLITLDRGGRSAPLNLGLREAVGRYVAVFDDDDIVMGHWVEEFAKAERDNSGRILRVASLRQDSTIAEVRGMPVLRSIGAPRSVYAHEFYMAQHLATNQSPQGSWVFPRSLFLDFGIEFDESMTTTEDWELLLRSAEIAGVTDIPAATFIYRWWSERESSRTAHSSAEWLQNQSEIERRIDAKPLLLPAGETNRLREDMRELRALRRENVRLMKRNKRLALRVAEAEARSGVFLGPVRSRLKVRTRAKRILGR